MHVFVSHTLKTATNIRQRRRPTCLIEDGLRESGSKSEDIKISSWRELRAAPQDIRIALLCRCEADTVKLPVLVLFTDSLPAQRNASDAQTIPSLDRLMRPPLFPNSSQDRRSTPIWEPNRGLMLRCHHHSQEV
ncbi:hypothetical protein PG995_007642 [Apiospora arundinis]